MLTLLVGTSRPQSRTRRVADFYASLLDELGAAYQFLDLTDLPVDFLTAALYHNAGQHADFNRFIAPLAQSDKLVIFAPEYNCSIPGVLKAFIDGLPYPGGIRGKKAALVALSTGSQGGLLNAIVGSLRYFILPGHQRIAAAGAPAQHQPAPGPGWHYHRPAAAAATARAGRGAAGAVASRVG